MQETGIQIVPFLYVTCSGQRRIQANSMKRQIAIRLAACWLAVAASGQPAAHKIGVINVQKALITTKDGQKALQDLQARVAPKQKEFEARQQVISQLEDQLKRGANLLADDKKVELAREIDGKKKKLERDTQDAQEDVQAKQQQVLQNLSQKLMTVLSKYAKENQFLLIVESGEQGTQVIYAAESIDITNDVVGLYDKQYGIASGKE